MNWEKDLKNPPKQYRPTPFWSWNEHLAPEETVRQVEEMEKAGIGGYFMHARGGLQTEYLSDEWFDNIQATLDRGEELGMHSWGYDENGWPSGFGGGLVNGMGEKYQQKYLRCEKTAQPEQTPHTVTNLTVNGDNYHFYYEVNPFYVDTMDKEVIEAFLSSTHEAYKTRLGDGFTKMDGFFTDEPQVSRNGIPWSLIFEAEYEKAYGESILPELAGLFLDVPGCEKVRYRFWALVRDLFAENFNGTIYRWCQKNGSRLTGHMVLEEWYYSHILANGSCMAPYEYMDIPGMDHLCRSLASVQTEMQLSSVANQLGKKQILSETFALSGWNVSFEDLRRIYEHQMVHGINLLCQHLEGYSLRGIRKRDYPASLFVQQPWWQHYRLFNDRVSRIGMLIAEGKTEMPVLVLHTVESGWCALKDGCAEAPDKICALMVETMNALEREQIQYHLGDGRILARHGKVQNGRLTVGEQAYSVVIVPPATTFGRNTFDLLCAFKEQGGTLIFTEQQPTFIDGIPTREWESLVAGCPVADHNEVAQFVPDSARQMRVDYTADRVKTPIFATRRRFEDKGMTLYYLVNSFDVTHEAVLTVPGVSATLFDPMTGEEIPADWQAVQEGVAVHVALPENGSVLVFAYDREQKPSAKAPSFEAVSLTEKLRGEWEIVAKDDNALTLDVAEVYFDGECAGKNVPISDVQEMACAFGRKVDTALIFRFEVTEKAFSTCRLVLETPEIFTASLNGNPVDLTVVGTYFDQSFKTVDIAPWVKEGTNELVLRCDFEQSKTVYDNIAKSLLFESEKNKLTYDMELEAVYVVGDFGVTSATPFENLNGRALRTAGGFAIGKAPKTVQPGALAPQGYPFFAGTMTFRKTVNLTQREAQNATVSFDRLPSTVTTVRVNGHEAGKVLWHPYSLRVAPFCHEGENEIEITVTGNLRNLLGPFHLKEGECLAVGPGSFFHSSPIWVHGDNPNWTDTYCFVEYGVFF